MSESCLETQCRLYRALVHCVATLSSAPELYHQLFHTVFQFPWPKANAECRESYLNFLTHLVSANGTYIVPTLKFCVRHLCPEVGHVQDWTESDNEAVLQALAQVHRVVPGASSMVIFPLLCTHFPHQRLDSEIARTYVSNLLRLTKIMPFLLDPILSLIVERIMAIDVEVVDESTGVRTKNEEDHSSSSNPCDALMLQCFEFLEQLDDLSLVFQPLLKCFERNILTTYRAKSPQFLLFYVASRSPVFRNTFVSQLVTTALSSDAPLNTRQNCAAYVASYLARASSASFRMLQITMSHVLDWCLLYQRTYHSAFSTCRSDDRVMFDTLFQLVAYMLCFRGPGLVKVKAQYEFVLALPLQKLVSDPELLPLSQCPESIQEEFLHFCESIHVFRPEEVLEFQSKCKGKTGHRPLFFPFDPIPLCERAQVLKPEYIFWRQVELDRAQLEEVLDRMFDSEESEEELEEKDGSELEEEDSDVESELDEEEQEAFLGHCFEESLGLSKSFHEEEEHGF